MKKLISLLIITLFAITLSAACGSEPQQDQDVYTPPSEVQNTPAQNDPAHTSPPDTNNDNGTGSNDPTEPEPFFVVLNNTRINMDDNISIVIAQLGEPLGVFEAPSCAFDGIDRIFSYSGVQLYTYPSGDDDFIHTVAFFDDNTRTAEGGIRLGSSLQAVLDAYGNDFRLESGMYTFKRGDTLLEFLVENDVVIGITYRLDIEIQIG